MNGLLPRRREATLKPAERPELSKIIDRNVLYFFCLLFAHFKGMFFSRKYPVFYLVFVLF